MDNVQPGAVTTAEQIDKRRNLASRIMASATEFIDAVAELNDQNDEYTRAGLVFADSDFTGTSLQHLDAATLVSVLTYATQLATYMRNNNIDVVFYKVKA